MKEFITDTQLEVFVNSLGLVIVLAILTYHYVSVNEGKFTSSATSPVSAGSSPLSPAVEVAV
jgi:hypothetical protein